MCNLTKEQLEAIQSEGNTLCIASAGSGKTSVFVQRIAHLIQKGVRPYNILGITFTDKAASEMRERLTNLIDEDVAAQVHLSTIHSVFYRQLLASNMSNFRSLKPAPEWWKQKMLNDLAKKQTYNNHLGLNLGITGVDLGAFISNQKSRGLNHTNEIIIDTKVNYVKHCCPLDLQRAWREYERLKAEAKHIDFDDMLLVMKKSLIESEDFLNICRNKFKYIQIDECQDSSPLMLECISLINNEQVFQVGDIRQSIYSFQGSNVENILRSSELFSNQKVIQLHHNFRSTENVVALSNEIINHSPIKDYDSFVDATAVKELGNPVEFNMYHNEYTQIEAVAKHIEESHKRSVPYHENFILVRTNNSTMPIEEVLTEMDIPHVVSKSGSFYEKKEILDLLSYARLAININDDVSFRRVYNTPNRFLSNKLMEDIQNHANDAEISLFQAITGPDKLDCGRGQDGIDSFINVIQRLRPEVDSLRADKFLGRIVNTTGYAKFKNYKEYLKQTAKTPDHAKEREASVDRLINSAKKFKNIRSFLAFIVKIQVKQQESKNGDSVKISTIHSSKGLEAEQVFVVNCVEDVLPHKFALEADGLEEERRLFYVAASRAKSNLFMSWYLQDEEGDNVEESRFVSELLGVDTIRQMKRNVYRGDSYSETYYWTVD